MAVAMVVVIIVTVIVIVLVLVVPMVVAMTVTMTIALCMGAAALTRRHVWHRDRVGAGGDHTLSSSRLLLSPPGQCIQSLRR
jgi:amino acid transporter